MTEEKKKKSTPAKGVPKAKKKFPVLPVVFGLMALLLVLVIAFTGGVGVTELGDPVVEGDALPFFSAEAGDPAVGTPIPTVNSTDYKNTPTAIANNGVPKVLLFLAHWCPNCQAELPVVQAWINAGLAPTDVEIIAIATSINSARPNYPPSDWFEREGWTPPVVMDDSASTIGQSFGVTAYPFWVFVDAAGNVSARVTGQMGVAAAEGYIAAARAG